MSFLFLFKILAVFKDPVGEKVESDAASHASVGANFIVVVVAA